MASKRKKTEKSVHEKVDILWNSYNSAEWLFYFCASNDAHMKKVVNVLNFFSYLLFAGILLLVYAYLPISVNINIEGIDAIHKQTFFYYIFGIFLIGNLIFRISLSVLVKQLSEQVGAWLTLLIMVVNVYFTLLIGFVGVWNNQQSVAASSYSYLNYLGPLFLLIWIIGLIIFISKNRA